MPISLYKSKSWGVIILVLNIFMFLFNLKSGECEDKKERQTIKNDDLSLSVHPTIEILNLWEDFKKVVEFIETNSTWLKLMMERMLYINK